MATPPITPRALWIMCYGITTSGAWKQLNMRQIVELAHTIRDLTALTPDEFGLYQNASQQLSRKWPYWKIQMLIRMQNG